MSLPIRSGLTPVAVASTFTGLTSNDAIACRTSRVLRLSRRAFRAVLPDKRDTERNDFSCYRIRDVPDSNLLIRPEPPLGGSE